VLVKRFPEALDGQSEWTLERALHQRPERNGLGVSRHFERGFAAEAAHELGGLPTPGPHSPTEPDDSLSQLNSEGLPLPGEIQVLRFRYGQLLGKGGREPDQRPLEGPEFGLQVSCVIPVQESIPERLQDFTLDPGAIHRGSDPETLGWVVPTSFARKLLLGTGL
jgi:hypothetical protein